MATLKFCGAAGTVTGSCSHITTDTAQFMVDCGLFQGNKTTQKLNYEEFPFDPRDVEFLILTHAHIDHSGLLPKLVKHGFNGPIYATSSTVDLLEFMLLDGASIQVSNTEHLNRKKKRRGLPQVQPLYVEEDAQQTLKQLRAVDYDQWFEPKPGVNVRFWNAGHILGSASAELKLKESDSDAPMRMLFSGDIGPEEKVFHPEPDAPDGFDYLICESTYGDRDRDDYTLVKRREALRDELVEGLARGGNVVIPSFAVERSQELLHDIGVLVATGEIENAEVYLDSPLARKVTKVFMKHVGVLEDIDVDPSELFRHKNFRMVESVDESKAVNRIKKGAIIISASGMCDAGRIQHHLKANIWRDKCTILFVGYQSPGTLGHIITSGAEDVKIHGELYKIKANIRRLGNYSAHADRSELVDWITERAPVVGGLFLNHGDDDARAALRELIAKKGIDKDKIHLPAFDESFELVASGVKSTGRSGVPAYEASLKNDWHNDYAKLLLEVTNRLENAKDGQERQAILGKLLASLKE